MEPACLRHTEIPHTSGCSPISSTISIEWRAFTRTSRRSRFLCRSGEGTDYPAERRAALVAALRARNGESASLDLLARPGTVAVVTGQQVGLFSGPAYTIYKALTAARLAAQLNAQGIPAVPIFWLATEDHDFAEVNHSFVFGADIGPLR